LLRRDNEPAADTTRHSSLPATNGAQPCIVPPISIAVRFSRWDHLLPRRQLHRRHRSVARRQAARAVQYQGNPAPARRDPGREVRLFRTVRVFLWMSFSPDRQLLAAVGGAATAATGNTGGGAPGAWLTEEAKASLRQFSPAPGWRRNSSPAVK